jgi:hypothetical protein
MLVISSMTKSFDWMLTRDSGTRRKRVRGGGGGGESAWSALSVVLVIARRE